MDSVRELTQQYPANPFVHFLYGQLLIPTDHTAAIEEMRREVQINPNSGEVCATSSLALDG